MPEKLTHGRASAFEHLFDAVLILDDEGRIADLNHGAEVLTGCERSDWLARPLDAFYQKGSPVLESHAVDTALHSSGSWRGTNTVRGRRQCTAVETVLVPLRNGNGRVRGAMCINRAIDEPHDERLFELAHTDQVTGLPNRRLLQDRMKQMLAHNRRTGQELAVLFLDLDQFKHVNDAAGHEIGDVALKSIAERMQGVLREDDTLARWGGDEFVVLLAAIDGKDGAMRVAEKLLSTVDWPVTVQRRKFDLGISIGVAMSPAHGRDAETLIRRADTAMYQAKDAGGQRACMAQTEASESAA